MGALTVSKAKLLLGRLVFLNLLDDFLISKSLLTLTKTGQAPWNLKFRGSYLLYAYDFQDTCIYILLQPISGM